MQKQKIFQEATIRSINLNNERWMAPWFRVLLALVDTRVPSTHMVAHNQHPRTPNPGYPLPSSGPSTVHIYTCSKQT